MTTSYSSAHVAVADKLRIATVTLTIALIALIFAWHLSPSPSIGNATLAMVLSIPLLAPLYGLTKGRRYTYKWTTLCVLPYLIIGCTEVIANPQRRTWSATMLLLGLLLFAALLGFLRTGCDLDKPIDSINVDPTNEAL
jgi:uncharacterized membrane protein